jgi:Family of unknown function (DUF5681)
MTCLQVTIQVARPFNLPKNQWKPGVSGNPNGRPRIPEHLRNIPSLTADEVNKIISKYTRMSLPELEQVIAEKKAPALEMAICSNLIKSILSGDYANLSFVLDRSVGKVTEKSEIAVSPKAVSDDDLDLIPKEKLIELLAGD